MVSKKAINKENLLKLGADHLADLLLEISKSDTTVKRMLKTAIAGSLGDAEAAREIRKRLNTISKSKSHIEWDKKKTVLQDLEAQKSQIIKLVLPDDAPEALDLMWYLLRLSNGIYERIYEDNGSFTNFFHAVCIEIGKIAEITKENPEYLSNRLVDDLMDNGYGQYDPLLSALSNALGEEGLKLLKDKLKKYQQDTQSDKYKKQNITFILREIADHQGDVDEYLRLWGDDDFSFPGKSEEVAKRFLNAGRFEEAWVYIEKADIQQYNFRNNFGWMQTRIDILGALDRKDEAQTFRYAMFEKYLYVDFLKDYLKTIEEFDEFAAEQKALKFVITHPDLHLAIYFLCLWNAPHYLSEMILKRYNEVDGNDFETLPNAVKLLSSAHMLAATLVLRALIDHALEHAKSSRYKHTAKHLKECIALSKTIKDYSDHISHESYYENIKKRHSKKASFWEHLQALS